MIHVKHTVHRVGDTTLLLCPMPSTTVSVRIICGSGSLDDNKPGAAHYLEHMFFKGTPEMSAMEVNRRLARLGSSNAYTSDDRTVFHVDTVSKHGNNAFDLLLDLLLNGSIAEEDIKIERGPILEELRAYKDHAWSCLYETIEQTIFGVDPVLGFEDTIKSMNRNDLMRFRELYTADNIAVALVGDLSEIDIDRVKAQLEAARWASGSRSPVMPSGHPIVSGEPMRMWHSSEQAIVAMLMPASTSKVDSKAGYPSTIAINALGGGMHSILWRRIRDELGLAYAVGAFDIQPRGDRAGMIAYAMVSPDAVQQTIDEMHSTIWGAADNIIDDEIETATANLVFDVANASQTPSGYAHGWIDCWFDDPDIRGHAGFIEDMARGEVNRSELVREALRSSAKTRQVFLVNAP